MITCKTSCEGKRVYYSAIQARVFAGITQDRSDRKVHGYKCRYCPYWHVGGNHGTSRKQEAMKL